LTTFQKNYIWAFPPEIKPNLQMTNPDFSAGRGRQFDAIVYPAQAPLRGKIVAQPSKNYTTRFLLAAALADGESTVKNCATSADSMALQLCLEQLGARIIAEQGESTSTVDITVEGTSGNVRLRDEKPVNPGNAGAVLRFLLAVAATLPAATFVTDHTESLGKRPNDDLLDALRQLGCESESNSGRLPITLHGGNLKGGDVSISGARSSQFLSGLLFLAPLIGQQVRIKVKDELVSKAPVRQTLEVLERSGIDICVSDNFMTFTVEPGAYKSGTYQVNGDWPGSAALLAAVAVTGGQITMEQLYDDQQGEKASATVLSQMGVSVSYTEDMTSVTLNGLNGALRAVEFDGDLATDAVLALMGAACVATGRTRFYNVSNLRIKECDRISEPIRELRKLGVKCWEGKELNDPDPDAIIIEGNPEGYEGGVTVDGRDDHRVIMLLSIVGLCCRKPVRIKRAHQVSKSYPNYFNHLATLGARVELTEVTA
jgi:3-phosphoshikimate 1-carboxyvinyltransferase